MEPLADAIGLQVTHLGMGVLNVVDGQVQLAILRLSLEVVPLI